jgi:hypothetical protein
MVGRCCCLRLASLTFITRVGFSTSTLAYMLDSLVRVSRRAGKSHFGKIARSTLRPHARQQTPAAYRNRPGWRSLCGNTTPSCLTTEGKAAASPSARHSLCRSDAQQWLGSRHRPPPKNKLLPLPSQRFQVF